MNQNKLAAHIAWFTPIDQLDAKLDQSNVKLCEYTVHQVESGKKRFYYLALGFED